MSKLMPCYVWGVDAARKSDSIFQRLTPEILSNSLLVAERRSLLRRCARFYKHLRINRSIIEENSLKQYGRRDIPGILRRALTPALPGLALAQEDRFKAFIVTALKGRSST
jgi:hypothetical protein